MSDVSRFRSALNGFNRTDVVNYVESISIDHQKQLRQLQSELTGLQTEKQTLTEETAALTQQSADLTARLEAAESALAAEKDARLEAEAALAALQASAAPDEEPDETPEAPAETQIAPEEELAAYRRAAQTERTAAARARRLREQVLSLCDGARTRYQDTGEEISALSEDLASGITRLQDALAELRLIFDQSQEAFDALDLPEEE